MKKLILAVVIVGAIALTVGIYWYFLRPSSQEQTTAILIPLVDGVEVEPVEAETDEKSLGQIKGIEGSKIKTDDTGRAIIILADNSIIEIDNNSEILLSNLPSSKNEETIITQIIGNTWHRVQRAENRENYRVKTPSTIIEAKGTVFAVSVVQEEDSLVTRVYAVGSEVDVESIDSSVDSIRLTADHVATCPSQTITEDQSIPTTRIPKEILESIWFKRNLEFDQLFRQIRQNDLYSKPELLIERLPK